MFGDKLYEQPESYLDPSVYERIVGKDKMSMLFGAKDLIEGLKEKERTAVNQCDGYSWTQTEGEVTISVPAPAGTTKKQVAVTFAPAAVTVAVAGKQIVSGALHARVVSSEGTWVLTDGVLEVSLTKQEKGSHWPALLRS